MVKVILSAGHGAKVSGANGFIKEHDEAVRLGKRVVEILGKEAIFFEEKTATTQRQNLSNIVAYHNSKARALDVSLHYNSAASSAATGSECLYLNPKLKNLSAKMSKAMAGAMGINDRGAKYRPELYFLRNTAKPAILLEVCFVSSKKDSDAYKKNFEKLAQSIAKVLADYAGINQERKNDKVIGTTSGHVHETYHVVVKGETLYKIATDHGLTVDKIKSLNGLTSNVIQVGDKLRIN